MAPPGSNTTENSPVSFKLREEIRSGKEQVEEAERKHRELEVEADLADVPQSWREEEPETPATERCGDWRGNAMRLECARPTPVRAAVPDESSKTEEYAPWRWTTSASRPPKSWRTGPKPRRRSGVLALRSRRNSCMMILFFLVLFGLVG